MDSVRGGVHGICGARGDAGLVHACVLGLVLHVHERVGLDYARVIWLVVTVLHAAAAFVVPIVGGLGGINIRNSKYIYYIMKLNIDLYIIIIFDFKIKLNID